MISTMDVDLRSTTFVEDICIECIALKRPHLVNSARTTMKVVNDSCRLTNLTHGTVYTARHGDGPFAIS